MTIDAPPPDPAAASPSPAPPSPAVAPAAPPGGLFGACTEILQQPESVTARWRRDGSLSTIGPLLLAAMAGMAMYGLAAGTFQGSTTLLLAAGKAPIILAGSLLLCGPSLYVFTSLAGGRVSGSWLAMALVGTGARIGLVMVALMPVAWLFSLSSRYLVTAVFIHVLVWIMAVLLSVPFLARALRAAGGAPGVTAWMLLLLVVAFQMTTALRPVLWRAPGQSLLTTAKLSFLEHVSQAERVVYPEDPGAAGSGASGR